MMQSEVNWIHMMLWTKLIIAKMVINHYGHWVFLVLKWIRTEIIAPGIIAKRASVRSLVLVSGSLNISASHMKEMTKVSGITQALLLSHASSSAIGMVQSLIILRGIAIT